MHASNRDEADCATICLRQQALERLEQAVEQVLEQTSLTEEELSQVFELRRDR